MHCQHRTIQENKTLVAMQLQTNQYTKRNRVIFLPPFRAKN